MKKEMRCAVFTGQRAVELQRFPIPEVDDDKYWLKSKHVESVHGNNACLQEVSILIIR